MNIAYLWEVRYECSFHLHRRYNPNVQRRNRIAQLLADWGLIGIVDVTKIQDIAPLNQIKVLAYKDKQDWILETKYNIGAKKKKVEAE